MRPKLFTVDRPSNGTRKGFRSAGHGTIRKRGGNVTPPESLEGVPQLPDVVVDQITRGGDCSLSEANEIEANRAIAAAMSVLRERRLRALRQSNPHS